MTLVLVLGALVVAQVARTLAVVWLAVLELRARRPGVAPGLPNRTPPPLASAIVPAFNEEKVLEQTLRALAASTYPRLQIVVVDDGSTDGTLACARRVSAELPSIEVLARGRNQGKARALSAGIAAARGALIVTVDADTQVEPAAVGCLVAALEEPGVAAAAGNVKVLNRGRRLTRWQALEYVTALNLERRAQSRLSCVTTVPGALGAYRREALVAAGGFVPDTLAEDTDLSLALLRAGQRIRYADDAVGWTEAPETAAGLFRQRTRWLYGNLQSAVKHLRGFTEGRPALRWLALPNFWYGHLVAPLLFPLSLALLPAALTVASTTTVAALALGGLLLDLALVVLAVRMDHEEGALLGAAVSQRLLYPFFLWAVFAVVCGRIVTRRDWGWPRVERIGAARRVAPVGEPMP